MLHRDTKTTSPLTSSRQAMFFSFCSDLKSIVERAFNFSLQRHEFTQRNKARMRFSYHWKPDSSSSKIPDICPY